jgi:hypothetical protein
MCIMKWGMWCSLDKTLDSHLYAAGSDPQLDLCADFSAQTEAFIFTKHKTLEM